MKLELSLHASKLANVAGLGKGMLWLVCNESSHRRRRFWMRRLLSVSKVHLYVAASK